MTFVLTGCKRDETIVTFNAPKPPRSAATTGASVAIDIPPPEIPGVNYTAPDGWVALPPHQFEAARFDPAVGDGRTFFTVSVMDPQLDLQPNIERWEGQVGNDPATAAAQSGLAKSTTLGGAAARSLDLKGPKGHLLVVVSEQPDKTLIFKLLGPEDKVETAKLAYQEFLDSVHFETTPAASPPVTQSPPTAPLRGLPFTFTAPADWKPDARPNAFRALSWRAGSGSTETEIFVTGPLTAATFDLASNLDRWRKQVGLTGPLNATDAKTTEIRMGDRPGAMVDLTGPAKRLIVAYTGKTDLWFFKIQGPAEAVALQKPAFDKFLKSLQFKAGI